MKLIKYIIGPMAFGDKQPSEEKMRLQESEFYDRILPLLD
jgi:hypothetical protein